MIDLVLLSGGLGISSRSLAAPASSLKESAELKDRYMHLHKEGNYAAAVPLATRACLILEEELGESAELGNCLSNLGLLYSLQAEFGRAESLTRRALAIQERALGPEHPEVARSLDNLAALLMGRGEYEKAESMYERALVIRAALDPKGPDVARSLEHLAVLYSRKGEHKRAEPLFERSLAIRETVLGPDHPHVAQSLANLAVHFEEQGEYEKAAPLHEKALAIRERTLGSEHPVVATALNNIGVHYFHRGEWGKAAPFYERALAIRERAFGPDHIDVALSLNNIAILYEEKGEYGKAEPLLGRALAIRENALGSDHPDVAVSLNNLALLYELQGKYGKAEPLHERALAIREGALGADHSDVGASLNNLAMLYARQGEYDRAEPLYKRALAISEGGLGLSHPDVAAALNNLAALYVVQGEYGKAQPLHERALAIREKTLGVVHPDVAASLSNLAMLHFSQGEYGKAEPLYERALAIWEKTLGPDHPRIAFGFNDLAELLEVRGEYGKAELLHERALAIRENALGPEHPDVAVSLNNLANLYDDQGKHDPVMAMHRRALEVEDANLVRTLPVASEARRLAFASTLSGSLDYALSLHLRVTPKQDAAEFTLTTLLRRKGRVSDLVAQSTAVLRRSLPEQDRYLLDDLSDVDSQIAVMSTRGPGKLGVEAFRQQLDELGQQRDRLWSELAKHSVLVEMLDDPITIEDVQGALSVGSALVELVQYLPQHDDAGVRLRKHETHPPPRYAAYLVFPDHFDWVDLGPTAPIDEHVKAFRKALQTKQAIPTDLYDAVMRPIVAKLGSAHRLVIAPAGALSLVPFGALHDGKRYLVEKYDLRYVTTGRDLLDPPASPPVTTTPITIVANPTGADLPDAELEADFLETFFPDTRILRAAQATETNVRTIERPLILHFATHGFFGEARNERDNPLFRSGLYLADIDQVEVDRDLDDGQLTAYEVSGMDLRGTQLVVLSACETAMGTAVMSEGKELMSEGMSGLRRAFATAGARTTVMSLWDVSGVTAQTTMEAYYRKLAEGQGPGEAMQAVQLEMLHSKEHAHPKDWAVFLVSGDDAPLDFPAGQAPREAKEEPPQTEGRGGCATKPSGRGAPTGSMLLGLLGLTAHRRRGR